MLKKKMDQELQQLYEQIRKLEEERSQDGAGKHDSADNTSAEPSNTPSHDVAAELGEQLSGVLGQLPEQYQKVVERLDKDLKEGSPASILAVFSTGLLIGYLLSR